MPDRSVPELDRLCTQFQAKALEGQINRPHGYLRGEAERIRGCCTVRHDSFAALGCQTFDHLDG